MLKNNVQNLIYKRYLERISFEELVEDLRDLCDDIDIRIFIAGILDEKISLRLIDEAKSYYAKKYSCEKDEVCYGNYNSSDCKIVPYVCVVGNIFVSGNQNCDKLKYVLNNIEAEGVRNFPNLEYVGNIGGFGEILANNKKTLNIPKLKYCKYFNLHNVILGDNILKETEELYIKGCRIKNLAIKEVSEKVMIQQSKIGQIPNLTYIPHLYIDNESSIKLLNSDLNIGLIDDYDIYLKDVLAMIDDAKKYDAIRKHYKEKHGSI